MNATATADIAPSPDVLCESCHDEPATKLVTVFNDGNQYHLCDQCYPDVMSLVAALVLLGTIND